jgi:hypothetical protein
MKPAITASERLLWLWAERDERRGDRRLTHDEATAVFWWRAREAIDALLTGDLSPAQFRLLMVEAAESCARRWRQAA